MKRKLLHLLLLTALTGSLAFAQDQTTPSPGDTPRPRRGGFSGPIQLGAHNVDGHAHDFQPWKKALFQFSQLIFKPKGN